MVGDLSHGRQDTSCNIVIAMSPFYLGLSIAGILCLITMMWSRTDAENASF
jgi:hypothetical protein